jgi:hypothetical protein
MTFEEFKKALEEGLYQWISKKERPASGWFYSLEEWAAGQFDKAYLEEYPPKREDGLLIPRADNQPGDAGHGW